jgi:hypothetical protein
MKNIHILSTDKPSRLHLNNSGLVLCDFNFGKNTINGQHIYITNDEEIKEGDIVKIPCGVGKVKELHWKIGNDKPSYIVEDLFVYKLRYGQKECELQVNSFKCEDVKKIILTTDQDLIKDGVQPIDDTFLEWFVKNPSCEEVEVETKDNWYMHTGSGKYWEDEPVRMKGLLNLGDYVYKIIIPQEEPNKTHYLDELPNMDKDVLAKMWESAMPKLKPKQERERGITITHIGKQETLIDFAKREANDNEKHSHIKLDYQDGIFYGILEGAKWQQERMYSEEEVKEIIKLSCEEGMLIQRTINDTVKIPYSRIKDFTIKMFEQFKKK